MVKQTLIFYLIPLIAFGLLGIVAVRDRRRWELSPPESWDRQVPNAAEIESPPDASVACGPATTSCSAYL